MQRVSVPPTARWPGVAAILFVGCAPARGPADAAELAALRSDPRALVEEVARIRGLEDSRKTRVVFDDEPEFARALDAKVKGDAIGPTSSDTAAFFATFDPPSARARRGSSIHEVLDEQVVAFYDEGTHSVHVREAALKKKSADELRSVLAHEIQHSLQTQHLAFPDLAKVLDKDTRLALNAVLEGDAMLTMLAHAAFRHRVPVNRALARASQTVAERSFRDYASASGTSSVLDRAPSLVRARLVFPYLQGLTFVGAIHRAGGFDLVNRVYAAPPSTTEHILHPEKYLAGEPAVPVEPPDAPEGMEVVASGRVGELQTRVILSRCLPHAAAASAAAGWGGDAFTIARGARTGPALVWATTWDDEREAGEFEAAASELVRCTRAAGAVGLPRGDSVVRRGLHVAVVRGTSEGGEALAVQALARVGERPVAVPPLGGVSIPPMRRARSFRAPYVAQGTWVNEELGLVASMPPGFGAEMPNARTVLFTRREPTAMIAGIALSDQVASGATIDELHAELAASLEQVLRGRELEYAGGRDVYLPHLGRAAERAWYVAGTEAGLRALVVPVCDGTGSFVLWAIWVDRDGSWLLSQWLSTVRPTAWAEPPICAELNP